MIKTVESGTEVLCGYCGRWRPWRRGFPYSLYARCWDCYERDALREAIEWAARPWWRRRPLWE